MKTKIILFLIILLGVAFRVYGINFDETCCQHPDERAIVMFALPLEFPTNLNPHFFAYGSFPLYLLKGVSVAAGLTNPKLAEYGQINLVGRGISVVAEIITMFLIFMIARLLFSARAGLLSSFIYALSVLPVQYSHFFTSDTLLTMFTTLTLFMILRFFQHPGIKNATFVGISFGLSLATKISAAPLLIAISASLAVDFIFIFLKSPHKIKAWLPHIPAFVKKLITEGVVILVLTLAVFTFAQPYAIIDFSEFTKQNLLQSQMTHNPYIFPYTMQYVTKIPYVYESVNIFRFGLGPFASILSLGGFLLILKNFIKMQTSKKSEIVILLTFFFLYAAVVGNFAVGFMRYLLPIYPIFAILAGFFLNSILDRIKIMENKVIRTGVNLVILLLIIIWPISFISVYSRTNTRIEASDWIRKNIPKGSTLAVEHWDDRLPMTDSSGYDFAELALYEQPDNENKWNIVAGQLSQSDYIIIASNRLYVPLQKLDDCQKFIKCYPLTSRYYKDLFSEKLGFEKIKEFSSYPTVPVLGWKIIDDAADESFTVYDHPKILIFKKK